MPKPLTMTVVVGWRLTWAPDRGWGWSTARQILVVIERKLIVASFSRADTDCSEFEWGHVCMRNDFAPFMTLMFGSFLLSPDSKRAQHGSGAGLTDSASETAIPDMNALLHPSDLLKNEVNFAAPQGGRGGGRTFAFLFFAYDLLVGVPQFGLFFVVLMSFACLCHFVFFVSLFFMFAFVLTLLQS